MKVNFDFIVIGGGLSGLCAAIAASRKGIKTALIQDRPVLGGNASSEIRMHICGADNHGNRKNARETGIIEEIQLENINCNRQKSYSIFDTVLWEKARFQENLSLFLNTRVQFVEKSHDKIIYVTGYQSTTEKEISFYANTFADCTGDGFIAYKAGCEIMYGREDKLTFNEPHAPAKADTHTMGNTLLFTTKDVGYPIEFKKPKFAKHYTEEDLYGRLHGNEYFNYWWIELGGKDENVITDGEYLRDELLKSIYGVWDHIKNSGDHDAKNHALDWIGFLPGKRESRRVIGDYILNENDLSSGKIFDDAIAYGGWPMDMHIIGGLTNSLEPTEYINMDNLYTIPYRAIYSKDISNLFIGGRNISASHMAFGSTRVIATCAVIGEAIGKSAYFCHSKSISPKDVLPIIKELQQELVDDDIFIPGFINNNSKDIAKEATIKASSELKTCPCINVVNGLSRNTNRINMWSSEEMTNKNEWIEFNFNQKKVGCIKIKFDSNLSKELMLTLYGERGKIPLSMPEELVKDYLVLIYYKNNLVKEIKIADNYLRYNNINTHNLLCDKIRLEFKNTHGLKNIHLFEVNILSQ
ncbi:MAG: FAD-dependent oxidoreductase [Lachnospirales bacterium]